jgi:hypothetical protein
VFKEMKRILIVAGCAAALAIPALALGQTARSNHFGHLVGAEDSPVKFKEALSSGSRSVTSFAVRNFEVGCEGGFIGLLKVTKLRGSVDVSDGGSFKVKDDNGKTTFKVQGQINRNKSFGTFRYFGRIPAEDGATRDCDSGRLGWITRP